MSREGALTRITNYARDGGFFTDLARRVAFQTESQAPEKRPELYRYLTDELVPSLEPLGFECVIHENPVPDGGPFLVATRREGDDRPTVMGYGHGDVVRGFDDQWLDGLNPWALQKRGERWYGRGSADNKGQHTINLAAMKAVLEERGELGFNAVWLFETGEEVGSPGLRDGGHHSGNWGGLLANPGIILAHAIASLTSASGEIRVPEWRPPDIPPSVGRAVAKLEIDGGENAPEIDPDWGEPGLTAAEKVFAWNTFEVLAFQTGNPDNPVNAVPPRASAHCHIRYVVPTDADAFLPGLRRHLDAHGFEIVEIVPSTSRMAATRLDPDHPWARWAVASIDNTSENETAVLPNLGGSLPNDVFSEVLGLPTIWVPHSYAACSQHAPNEHILEPLSEEALRIMTGLYWDLGEPGTPV